MSVQADSFQGYIDTLMTEKICVKEKEIDNEIEETKATLESGTIPTDGNACVDYVRNLRKSALSGYWGIKMWLNARIPDMINEATQMKVLQEIFEKTQEYSAIEACKEKNAAEIERITEKDMKLKEYDKFLLYGDSKPNNKKNNSLSSGAENVLQNKGLVEHVHSRYVIKQCFCIILGVLVTALCAYADYSILFSVFESSNYDVNLSKKLAAISVIALDLPPYILGVLKFRRNDTVRLWKLRGDSEDPGIKSDEKGYGSVIILVRLVIILLFIVYFILRAVLFLGGGDFNRAVRSILSRNFSFEGAEFSSADLISTFVPFTTSAVSFAVGWLLSSSYTDYVKAAILAIDQELDIRVGLHRENIIDCEKKKKDISDELFKLKQSVWTSYMGLGGGTVPENNAAFISQITNALRKLDFPLYQQVYQATSARLRDRALGKIQEINRKLAPYVSNQTAIISMKESEEEEKILDDIWTMAGKQAQSAATVETINQIDAQIERFQIMLKIDIE